MFCSLYCKYERIKPRKTFMSAIPKERLDAYGKPFYNANIDFFGPIIVKLSTKTGSNQEKARK